MSDPFFSQKKDDLIKKLQNEIEKANKEKADGEANGFPPPYHCIKCRQMVKFLHVLPSIRLTGMCPHCFHE